MSSLSRPDRTPSPDHPAPREPLPVEAPSSEALPAGAGRLGEDPRDRESGPEDVAAIERAQQLTDVVTRLRRALRSSIRTDYPWESLPMAQIELLQTLAAAPLRVGELAARQRLAPNTVSGLVGKLLEAGFVDRQADPGDRRTARIALTEAGHQQLEDWQRAHERRIATALGTLSAADHDAVMAALTGLDRLAHALGGTTPPPESTD